MKYFSKQSTAITFAAGLMISTVYAELAVSPEPALASHLAKDSLLTDITLAGSNLVAVGERGHIIWSEDGDYWQQAQVPVNVLLTSVTFKDDKIGYATGHDATLLSTLDGGKTWQISNYQPELDKPFLDVSYTSKKVVAVGAYGLYYESTDNGTSWQSVFHDELLIEDDRLYLQDIKEFEPENYEQEKQYLLPHFNQVDTSGLQWRMVGEAGFVAVSSDGGAEWQLQPTDYIGSYFSSSQTAQETLLVGLRGTVYRGADNAWNKIDVAAPATINQVISYQGTSYLFANSGNLFTVKGDSTGHKLFSDGKAILSGVVFEDRLVLATEAGIKSVPLSELSL